MGEISEALRRARRLHGPARRPIPAAGEPEPPELEQKEAEEVAAPDGGDEEVAAAVRPLPLPEPLPELYEDADLPMAEEVPRRGQQASLSRRKVGSWPARMVVVDGAGAAAESFRHIALRLRRELAARGIRTLAVVSALRAEGKTTVACNVALALASLADQRQVALVDLDLRKPSVAKALEIPRVVGIEQVLRGERGLRDACVSIDVPPVDVYPARAASPDAHMLLARGEFEVLIRELERRYEFIVFDTPPVLLVPDATVIAEHIGAVVTLARARRTSRRGFETMLDLLPPGKVLGSILNEGDLPARAHQYGYYGETEDDDEPDEPDESEAERTD
jgi:capsular exopolysaccharide synthesis family protein